MDVDISESNWVKERLALGAERERRGKETLRLRNAHREEIVLIAILYHEDARDGVYRERVLSDDSRQC